MAAEFIKGEVSGFYQTMNLLELIIEAIDAEVESRKLNTEELDNED